MGIRIVTHSDGYVAYYAICNECREWSNHALITGVQYKDGAVNCAMPNGWSHEDKRTGYGLQTVRYDYCPRCSVSPEYRK